MRLHAVPLLKNPLRKRRKAKRAPVKVTHKRQKYRSKRMRPFVIEAVQQHKPVGGWATGLRFLYWSGAKWITSRTKARHYATTGAAEKEARALIKKQPPSIRFVRVLQA